MINNEYFLNLGLTSLKNIASCDINLLGLDSLTFCHGYAGLLQIMNIMYIETGDEVFKNISDKLVDKILFKYDSRYPLSFKDISVDITNNTIYPKK